MQYSATQVAARVPRFPNLTEMGFPVISDFST